MYGKPFITNGEFSTEQLTLWPESEPEEDVVDPAERVYAMYRLGCVKIGHSVEPTVRARRIGGVLLAMTYGDENLEHRIHWRFRHYRYCHEFFLPAPPVLAWVASLPIQIRPWPGPVGPGPQLHLAA
jgi:hypothetical protein